LVESSTCQGQLLLTNAATDARTRLPLKTRGAILECMAVMSRRVSLALSFVVLASLFHVATVAADEIKLKDGTKIIGTIVGFEDSSFKVKTSYGFAFVQKDQVDSITVIDDSKKPQPAAKTPVATTSPAKSLATPASAAAKPEHERAPVAEKALTPGAKSAVGSAASANDSKSQTATSQTATSPNGVASSTNSGSPESASASKPDSATVGSAATQQPLPKPVAPEPMRELVSGNTYTNETYGFQMYKPPDWKLIEGARAILPGSITALGTDDQTTYLLIGQDASGKSLASEMDAAEHRLRDVMDNFRPLGEKRVTISGVSAIERRFRGSVDGRDWSGVAVYIAHGASVFTIFAMTLADTDLVQIQENVISRAITSMQFTKP
jgi:hypothetical protein